MSPFLLFVGEALEALGALGALGPLDISKDRQMYRPVRRLQQMYRPQGRPPLQGKLPKKQHHIAPKRQLSEFDIILLLLYLIIIWRDSRESCTFAREWVDVSPWRRRALQAEECLSPEIFRNVNFFWPDQNSQCSDAVSLFLHVSVSPSQGAQSWKKASHNFCSAGQLYAWNTTI